MGSKHKAHRLFIGPFVLGCCYRLKGEGPGNKHHLKIWLVRRTHG